MGEQLTIAEILPLPAGNERFLWRTAPQSAFEAWMRTHKYVPIGREGRQRPPPPRPFSADTQKSYAILFRQFLAFITARQVHVADATTRDIAAFIDDMPGRMSGKASSVTRRRALKVLNSAYTQMVKLQLRRDHPVQALIGTSYTAAETSPSSSVLSPGEHRRLLEYIDKLPRSSFEGARRAGLLAVAIGCGVCGEELRRLKRAQLRLDEDVPLLIMPPHGLRTEVSLPLARHTARILADWCAMRSASGAKGELLFPASIGRDEPVSLQSLHRYAVAALVAVGCEERSQRIGAQRVLRASFAARQLSYRSDDDVQRWMRLRTGKMIERYKRHAVRPDEAIV